MEMRFTQAARKHRIGKAHALHVMGSATPAVLINALGETRYDWVGTDPCGVELEMAVDTIDKRTGRPIRLVLHVMPTALRRNS